MTTQPSQYNHFRDALRERRDITDTYLELGGVPQLVGLSAQADDHIIALMRDLLNQQSQGIFNLAQRAQPALPQATDIYRDNLIAAVDGTDAISPLRFVSETLYATGVVRVTPASVHEPRASVTRTRAASYNPANNTGRPWNETIQEWAEYLRSARDNEISWVNTFREYAEREIAKDWLDIDHDHIVLIDGPILTQNLLSQDAAHNLLAAITSSHQAIGFIKELSANPLLVAIGSALHPGEAFVLQHWTNLLQERFRHGQEAIAEWIGANATDIVRVIYKTQRKAYAIECSAPLTSLALAILQHDPGGPTDHNIPMLLQIADAHVRSQFNGQAARDETLARFSINDPERFTALTNERSLR